MAAEESEEGPRPIAIEALLFGPLRTAQRLVKAGESAGQRIEGVPRIYRKRLATKLSFRVFYDLRLRGERGTSVGCSLARRKFIVPWLLNRAGVKTRLISFAGDTEGGGG